MGSLSIDGGLDNIDQSFKSEYAAIEVEAIYVIISLESEMEISCIPRSPTTKYYKQKEDDDLFDELLRLE